MKRTITLTVQQAKELYEQDNSFRETLLSEFSDVELGIKKELQSWNELKEIEGFYISSYSKMIELFKERPESSIKNTFKTEKQAQSALAMAQLSQLMADLGDECDVDWNWNDSSAKHTIRRYGIALIPDYGISHYQFLAFKTKEVRDAFLEKHKELIKQYFMI